MSVIDILMGTKTKQAFTPMPPVDPAMAGQAPMDPAMMGGQPPMDPAMMGQAPMPPAAPMDPAMMGGQPPMDPAMMGQAPMPPQAPMDPAMMGQAPMPPAAPMDPAMMGGQPPVDPAAGGDPMSMSVADLTVGELVEIIQGSMQPQEGGADGKISLTDVAGKLDKLLATFGTPGMAAPMEGFMGAGAGEPVPTEPNEPLSELAPPGGGNPADQSSLQSGTIPGMEVQASEKQASAGITLEGILGL